MTKSHLSDMPEFSFLVLSLSHSPGIYGHALWWGPDCSGYTEDVNRAGRYSRKEIEGRAHYLNNGEDTMAVREDLVIRNSKAVRFATEYRAEWWREKIQPEETTDDPNSDSSNNPF